MSVSKLPSGRWRAQVHDAHAGGNVSVSRILGGPGTFATKTKAKAAREEARRRLSDPRGGVTVSEFRARWLTDPLFARPKESTRLHNAERTKAFAAKYRDLPLVAVDDQVVGEWLAGGRQNGTVPALRAMLNDAASAKAGRLVKTNPFRGLGISKGPGNRHKQPPSEETVWTLIKHARILAGPDLAAWLQVAAFTGLRPGELDALRPDSIDLATSRIRVIEQWNAGSRTFTTPKNGQARAAILTPPAREAILTLPLSDGRAFVFKSLRGGHWTTSSRSYHWKAIRAAAGYTGTLYLCTRHFAGAYMVNVLQLPSEDVAIALGHTDGGDLVRRLYGHRDRDLALQRVQAAYENTGTVHPLRVVRDRPRTTGEAS